MLQVLCKIGAWIRHIDIKIFSSFYGDLVDTKIKGTVQRKLTGVLSGINRKLMICDCSDGYSFFNLKGLRSLKSKNVFSALTGTL
jgi:hypothetical protein